MATQPLPPVNGRSVLPLPLPPALVPASPDWLTSQASVFRLGSSGDDVIRHLLAAALEEIGRQHVTIATQHATIATLLHPRGETGALRRPAPSLRPAIRTLLKERAGPMTAREIEDALGVGRSLVSRLNEMVKDGQLTLSERGYAFAKDPPTPRFTSPTAPAPAPEAPAPGSPPGMATPTARGRRKRVAA